MKRGYIAVSLGILAALVLLFGSAQIRITRADGPCADPSGNCPNNGQVTFPTAQPAGPATGPCADPSGNCPNNGQVTFPAPAPSGPAQAPCADPSGNCPLAGPSNFSVSVNPATASIGDTVTVTGQGFTANGQGGNIFLDLVTPDGAITDMQIAPIQCVVTTNSIFYLYVVGCSSGSAGPIIVSDSSGNFSAALVVPFAAETGSQQLCVNSNFTGPVCTPFTVQG